MKNSLSMNNNADRQTFPTLNALKTMQLSESHKTLLFGSSHLQMDVLPQLYEALNDIGHCDNLDVIIVYCRGGEVNVARRIGLLLREFASHVRFIVPYYCQSAATILSLCANEIIAGPMAIFSPIDPQLHGAENGSSGPMSLSAQEIKTFATMAQDWFALPGLDAQTKSLELLSNNIFPPTMASFYRSCEEIKLIATEMLDFQLPHETPEARQKIVEKLLFGYHSHEYAISGDDLNKLGLNVKRNKEVEEWAWSITQAWQPFIGGKNRTSETASWNDTVIATPKGIRARHRRADAPAPSWQYFPDEQKDNL